MPGPGRTRAAGAPDGPGAVPHARRRLLAVFGLFVAAFAALRPVFLAREPNPFPVLGTSIFYSLAEVMEATYFTASFVGFAALVLALTLGGVLPRPPAPPPGPPARPPRGRRERVLIVLGVLLPSVVLLLPLAPPVLVADTLHHGEKLIFQGRPFAEAYRSYLPFKPVLFMKLAGLAGLEPSAGSYLAVREVVQRAGLLAVLLLAHLTVRLMRGRFSLLPGILFLLAFPLVTAALRHRYWILDMERMLFFLLCLNAVLGSLILRRRWPLVLAGAFAGLQFLASFEYAVFGACVLAAHVGLGFVRDRGAGARALAAAAAGVLPVAALLAASGQLMPLARFVAYTTKFPGLYGTPLLYRVEDPILASIRAPDGMLAVVIATWLVLLWAAGRRVPWLLDRAALDDRRQWVLLVLLLAVLTFKIGLGRSDVQHLYLPLVFSGVFLGTLALDRAPRLPRVPEGVAAAGLVAATGFAAVAGMRPAPVPPGFVFDPAPRIRAFLADPMRSDLAALRALLAATGARSIFFFSDQPLYNYLLDLPYPLRHPVLHEILTDPMLAEETARFEAWSPELVVWRAESWTGFIDGIRTPVRDYRLAAAILARYRPRVARAGWIVLARDPERIDRAALAAHGYSPIDAAALEETFDWRDMPYHIGRSPFAPPDFKRVTRTLAADACCAYRQGGRALIDFRGRAGTHTYALFPAMAPGYREAAWDPDSVVCAPCAGTERAASP